MSEAMDVNCPSRPSRPVPRYETLADFFSQAIRAGHYAAGDGLPSLREVARTNRVSLNTVRQAFAVLERRGLVQSRPRSGYYVASACRNAAQESSAGLDIWPMPASVSDSWMAFHDSDVRSGRNGGMQRCTTLGVLKLDPAALPVTALRREMGAVLRREAAELFTDVPSRGNPGLLRHIGRRLNERACAVDPDELSLAAGCMDAMYSALAALTRAGDRIVVESPFFSAALPMWASLGLELIEIPVNPLRGASPGDFENACRQYRPAAMILASHFSNPTGALMSEETKLRFAELANRLSIPLIEDDVFGELVFDGRPSPPIKAFDRSGDVLLCSSFSKTLAPGCRCGWIAAGRHAGKVQMLRRATQSLPATALQAALSMFLAGGDYDRHLARFRRLCRDRCQRLVESVARHLPAGTVCHVPAGGLFLWVELPDGADTVAAACRGAQEGIAIAHGGLFSLSGNYRRHVRLNFAAPPDEADAAVAVLSRLLAATPGTR